MSLGLLAAIQHSVRRMKADNARLRDRVDARMEQAGARGAGDLMADRPTEALACPICRETYAFGGTCPDCNEPLLSESLVEAGAELPPEGRWRGFLRGGVFAVVAIAATVLLHVLVEYMSTL